MKSFVLIVFAFVFLAVSPAFAGVSLDAKQVSSFVASLDSVAALTDQMRREGKQDMLASQTQVMQGSDFAPYSSGIQFMKSQLGSDYGRLQGIVKKHGFPTAESWAGVGDAVMLAYMALKADESGGAYKNMSVQMTPEMFAQVPPETRAQIETTLKMMDAVKNAPAGNKEAVRPYSANLEAAFAKFQQPSAQ